MLYWLLFFFPRGPGTTSPLFFLTGWATSYGFFTFSVELVTAFLAYCFGRAAWPSRLKAAAWLALSCLTSWRIYDLVTVGLRSDADIFKPYFAWLLFLSCVLIPLGDLVHRKKG